MDLADHQFHISLLNCKKNSSRSKNSQAAHRYFNKQNESSNLQRESDRLTSGRQIDSQEPEIRQLEKPEIMHQS